MYEVFSSISMKNSFTCYFTELIGPNDGFLKFFNRYESSSCLMSGVSKRGEFGLIGLCPIFL